MGLSAGGAGAIAGGLGDLFGGIFSGIGNFDEAKAYKTAAKYAQQNAVISEEAGAIKEEQASRAIFKTLGAQKSEYAGSGLTGGGSAQYVLRDSISQGSLEKAIINEQTQINVNGYEAQAAEFQAMSKAAKAAGTGDIIGGVLQAATAIIPFL
jgi:hypothetical protein